MTVWCRLASLLCCLLAACGRGAGGDAGAEPPPPAPHQPTTSQPTPAAIGWPAWACTLGSIVDAAGIDPVVPGGTYQSVIDYTQDKLITMESTYDRRDRGRVSLTLGPGGVMTGCLGMDQEHTSSVSHFASSDKKDRTNHSRYRTLQGVVGRWEQLPDGARVFIDAMGPRCDLPADKLSPLPSLQLVCGTLTSDRLPVRALACREIDRLSQIEELGLDLGVGPRPGPWQTRFEFTMHDTPNLRASCGPWLLLGADPGLTIQSTEGRGATVPAVTFTSGAAPFRPADFIDKDAGP